jgi:transcriptional regulator with XRE-family HTH domain
MAKFELKIHKAFKAYMDMQGWTISDVAKKTNYSKQQVSQILSGTISPSFQFLRRLSEVTGIKAKDLLD